MRSTVTLDADTEQLIRRRMRERGMTFEEAINDAIRQSEGDAAEPFRTRAAALGRARANLDRALRVAADLEDDALVRRMQTGG